jgi:hypothetical protein
MIITGGKHIAYWKEKVESYEGSPAIFKVG